MSLQTSLDETALSVNTAFLAASMDTQMATWNSTWPAIFDEANVGQRTVRDWFITSLVVEESYSSTPTITDRQKTISVVARTLEAAIAAESAGRISGVQANALEAAFNVAWP